MRSQVYRGAFAAAFLALWGGFCAAGNGDARPFIGLQLGPVPELLAKHIGLGPGQGVLITNVAFDSPAEEMGLEPDDVVVAFRGRRVDGPEELARLVRRAELGTEASLDVIHRGRRKTLRFELRASDGRPRWKRPDEPHPVLSWRPGRVYRIGPEGQGWVEIEPDKSPDVDVPGLGRIFQEMHTFHFSTDEGEYSVTIEGDPLDEESQVIVATEVAKHMATVGTIDALPEEYRDGAEEAVRKAGEAAKEERVFRKRLHLPAPLSPQRFQEYFRRIPAPNVEQWSERKDRALERLEEQMEGLQGRMKELEQMFDRLFEKEGTDGEADEPEESTPSTRQEGRAI